MCRPGACRWCATHSRSLQPGITHIPPLLLPPFPASSYNFLTGTLMLPPPSYCCCCRCCCRRQGCTCRGMRWACMLIVFAAGAMLAVSSLLSLPP